MVALLKIQILSITVTSLTNLIAILTFATDYWSILVYDLAKLHPYAKWIIIEEKTSGAIHIINNTNGTKLLSNFNYNQLTTVVGMEKDLLLFATHKGLFRQCNYLSNNVRARLQLSKCRAVKTTDTQYDGHFYGMTSPRYELIRLYNVAASCAILIILLLGCNTFVGISVGILNNVVLATMTVGVIYLIATLFSMFVVVIMHTILISERKLSYCTVLQILDDDLCSSHSINASYSFILSYLQIIFCFITSVLWLLLQKKQRKFAQH
ncbi:unnamed protein product [Rotaria magnacalcarata]|uniref:Uncharacterized protein n=1 Tax=Rotaria magnacalcarata TaxID=392030 RepID=A0A816YZ79_9BILA|nr:unnamed protein product [Rotaria magnacalcarata]CAF1427183.1 unnamed protein product [Rotaria magnacalcarata]CAF2176154.1 unnamed protein product [Rotaria magnacalcarata]